MGGKVSVSESIRHGDHAISVRDFDSARRFYETATKNGSSLAHYRLGELLSAQCKYEEAFKCYKEGLRVDGGSEEGQLLLCRGMRDLGLLEAATAGAYKLVRNNTSKVECRVELGLLLTLLGRPYEAASHLDQITDTPDTPGTLSDSNWGYLLGGTVYLLKCKLCNTLSHFTAAADRLAADSLRIHVLGEAEEALRCFDRAISIDSSCVTSLVAKGIVIEGLCREMSGEAVTSLARRYQDAIECFEKAIALDDTSKWAHARLGAALFKYCHLLSDSLQGSNLERAKTHCRLALELPCNPLPTNLYAGVVMIMLGTALTKKIDIDEVIRQGSDTAATTTEEMDVQFAVALLLANKAKVAERHIQKVTERRPDSYTPYFLLARIHLSRGEYAACSVAMVEALDRYCLNYLASTFMDGKIRGSSVMDASLRAPLKPRKVVLPADTSPTANRKASPKAFAVDSFLVRERVRRATGSPKAGSSDVRSREASADSHVPDPSTAADASGSSIISLATSPPPLVAATADAVLLPPPLVGRPSDPSMVMGWTPSSSSVSSLATIGVVTGAKSAGTPPPLPPALPHSASQASHSFGKWSDYRVIASSMPDIVYSDSVVGSQESTRSLPVTSEDSTWPDPASEEESLATGTMLCSKCGGEVWGKSEGASEGRIIECHACNSPISPSTRAGGAGGETDKGKLYFAKLKQERLAAHDAEVKKEQALLKSLSEEERVAYLEDKAKRTAHSQSKGAMLAGMMSDYRPPAKVAIGKGRRMKGKAIK